ncbi:unnamed protein product, partial [Phaeothamnion confervicola]
QHGRGHLKLCNQFSYEGQWAEDAFEGRGTCEYGPAGGGCNQRYEGMFRAGRRDGRGTLFFESGAYYEGRFRDDRIDGQGMLRIPEPIPDGSGEYGDWMVPVQFQSDIERIHAKAGFDKEGL